MTNLEDPGWRPSLRDFRWLAIPVVGPVVRVRARRAEPNGLVALRSGFLTAVAALLVFVFLLGFIAPRDGEDRGWVPWAVAVIGIASLAYVGWVRRRPLPTTSPEALARTYRALFFIGVGGAEAAALGGLVGVFLGAGKWVYLVGLAFGLVGLRMIAPTRSDIGRRQREITAAGSRISLLDALISAPTR
jgi:hypothetical protein